MRLMIVLALFVSPNTFAQGWWEIPYHQGSGTNSNTITRDNAPPVTKTDNHSPSVETERIFFNSFNTKAGKKKLKQLSEQRSRSLDSLNQLKGNRELVDCTYCRGSGLENCRTCKGVDIECVTCNGKGVNTCMTCRGAGTIRDLAICNSCNGNGTLQCSSCQGSGKRSCKLCKGLNVENCHHCRGAGKKLFNQ